MKSTFFASRAHKRAYKERARAKDAEQADPCGPSKYSPTLYAKPSSSIIDTCTSPEQQTKNEKDYEEKRKKTQRKNGVRL